MEEQKLSSARNGDVRDWFRKLARQSADSSGSPPAFLVAVVVVIAWVATGPLFNYSNTWQLVINSVTNVVTFIMVFLIQHTQNRDSKATQLKLDELIRSIASARNSIINLDSLTDEQLAELEADYKRLSEAGSSKRRGTDQPTSERK